MDSHQRDRVIAAPDTVVRAAIDMLMREIWPDECRLVAETNGVVTFAVEIADADGVVWLTWRRTPHTDGTHVVLTLDELDSGPTPDDELEQLLDLLAADTVRQPRESRRP